MNKDMDRQYKMMTSGLIFILLFSAVAEIRADYKVSVSDHDIRLLVNSEKYFNLTNTNLNRTEDKTVDFQSQYSDIVRVEPTSIVTRHNESNWKIKILGLKAGFSVVSVVNVTNTDPSEYSQAFVQVTVQKSNILYHLSIIVGWIYFAAWSISFYPQIYSNYKRQSVTGLNFDFLSLNLVGFAMYSLYNCGLYWIPEIEQQYLSRHPKGVNPVQVNDIFFALHAMFATLVTILQCFIYETGSQRISTTARFIHLTFFVLIVTFTVLALNAVIQWLDFLYYCSSIKLAITLIKYVPQAYFNYKRQSTVGWSIGNILLDFTGGILSILQIFINAYNYDDWKNITGDVIKFGLGLFSVVFDVFFMIQHYVLYRNREDYTVIPGDIHENQESVEEINSDFEDT